MKKLLIIIILFTALTGCEKEVISQEPINPPEKVSLNHAQLWFDYNLARIENYAYSEEDKEIYRQELRLKYNGIVEVINKTFKENRIEAIEEYEILIQDLGKEECQGISSSNIFYQMLYRGKYFDRLELLIF